MQTILRILELAGGYRPTLSVRIERPPYLPLVIEGLAERGPCGLRTLSVAHYGEQNGDPMRDPEMCFELSKPIFCSFDLYAYYYRNDYMGVEQWSRRTQDGLYAYHDQLYMQHKRFAAVWDKNIASQGFLEAFDARCIRG